MLDFSVVAVTGGKDQYATGEVLSDDLFGGIYTGQGGFDRFDHSIEAAGIQTIRWPGGSLSERAPWYGLEFPDLVDPNSGKVGLTQVMTQAVEKGLGVNLILPTAEYLGQSAQVRSDVTQFLERLHRGEFGELPETVIIEIGNEYYAQSAFRGNPAGYGATANVMLEAIADYVDAHPDFQAAHNLKFSAQMGRTTTDNAQILSQISTKALSVVDMVSHHRLSWVLDGADSKTEVASSGLQAWQDAGAGADLELYLSAWNVASLTRKEAKNRFIDHYQSAFGVSYDPDAIDLKARNDGVFETYWQTGILHGPQGQRVQTNGGLAGRDYGLAQASAMIEILSSYIEIGADAAALYGFDIPHAAHATHGQNVYVGGALFGMLSETLPGKRLLQTDLANKRDDEINMRAFEGEGETVIYLSADDIDEAHGKTVRLDLQSLGSEVLGVSGRRLTSELDADWMARNGVVDRPDVDETNEAGLYTRGKITEFDPVLKDGAIDLNFKEDYEVIEITIKTSSSFEPENISAPEDNNGDDIFAIPDTRTETSDTDENSPTPAPGRFLTQEVIRDGDGFIFGRGASTAERSTQDFKTAQKIIGSHQGDVIHAGAEVTEIWGRNGHDQLRGYTETETVLHGGNGNDHLSGGTDVKFYGGAGHDYLIASKGDDLLHGGTGNDVIFAGGGRDTVISGSGADTIWLDHAEGSAVQIMDFNLATDWIGFTDQQNARDLNTMQTAFSDLGFSYAETNGDLVLSFSQLNETVTLVNMSADEFFY